MYIKMNGSKTHEMQLYTFFDFGARRGELLRPRLSHVTPEKVSVPIVQENGLALGPVWTGEENLTPTGIWTSDLPARSESQYRMS